ncbi:ABC transporter substrate-binding protein [Actinokineospora fastidiosa]|uniref:ABC transporter substrate-binding protein n=1 Tax=Actinokineospora fastidiosa TaxID=1816 RepID=UPI0016700388|nr:extracellular solute-binding protein [Actinokineospora fastidiosa]
MSGKAVALVGVLAAGMLVACGSGKTEITVGLFGDHGYADLFAEYEQAHPDIDIVERVAPHAQHHDDLAAHLAGEEGAADVEAVDAELISRFTATPEHFVDLNSAGAFQRRWLDWAWTASLSRDGRQIGYAAEVGGLALCYRAELVDAPDWPTWEAYVEAGRRFQAQAPEDVRWMDGAATLLDAIIDQAPVGYHDAQDAVVVDTNPDIARAWAVTTAAVDADLSAGLSPGTEQWTEGLKQGRFATILCSASQLAAVRDAGGWGVVAVPGKAGNRGGSYLTVPAQGDETEAAVALADWLTAPEQQARRFARHGRIPSTPSVYGEQSLAGRTDPALGDARVGVLFTEAAQALKPQYRGPDAAAVQTALDAAVQRVEQGQAPDESWARLLTDLT